MQPTTPAEVTLDGNDVAELVECAIRHPAPEYAICRVGGYLAITPTAFRQIFRFGLEAPVAFAEIRKIVAEELDKASPQAGIAGSEPGKPADKTLLPRMPLPAHLRDRERDRSAIMSDWSKVTRPIPVPNEWTKPFWEAAKRGVLELQRCQSCGHFQHPPYATCTQCVVDGPEIRAGARRGTIYAYTIMYHTGDKRFASAVPYASIIVELDDAPGALMAGNLLEAEYTEAKVGRRVEVVFEKLNDDITLPQFRLAPTTRPGE